MGHVSRFDISDFTGLYVVHGLPRVKWCGIISLKEYRKALRLMSSSKKIDYFTVQRPIAY